MKTLLLSIISILELNSYAQNVNIPDANFKAYLVGNTAINTNIDTEIQVSEANTYNGLIICNFTNISDLTGIEAFTALDSLNLFNNNLLTSLDVSNNTALTFLNCSSNGLTSLDVSGATALIRLDCSSNELTSLDVSNNTALTFLNCSSNGLTSLDVSNNTALTYLNCFYNELTALDVSNNTALTSLGCGNNQLTCLNVKNGNNTNFNTNFSNFAPYDNPNLTCIEVDNVAWSDANWTNIDAQMYFSTSCGSSCTAGVSELNNNPKQLIKIVDLLGRETPFKPNTVLIYVYDDGTTERVFKLEE